MKKVVEIIVIDIFCSIRTLPTLFVYNAFWFIIHCWDWHHFVVDILSKTDLKGYINVLKQILRKLFKCQTFEKVSSLSDTKTLFYFWLETMNETHEMNFQIFIFWLNWKWILYKIEALHITMTTKTTRKLRNLNDEQRITSHNRFYYQRFV